MICLSSVLLGLLQPLPLHRKRRKEKILKKEDPTELSQTLVMSYLEVVEELEKPVSTIVLFLLDSIIVPILSLKL